MFFRCGNVAAVYAYDRSHADPRRDEAFRIFYAAPDDERKLPVRPLAPEYFL